MEQSKDCRASSLQGMHSVGPEERLMIEVYDEKRRFSSITSTAVAPFMKQDKRLDKLKFSLYTRTSFLFIITRFGVTDTATPAEANCERVFGFAGGSCPIYV